MSEATAPTGFAAEGRGNTHAEVLLGNDSAGGGLRKRSWQTAFVTLLLSAALLLPGFAAAQVVVTNTNDSGPDSLRAALVSVPAGGTITFDPALSGHTITLTSLRLLVTKSMTITGPAPGGIVIDGVTSFQIIDVSSATPVDLTLENLRLLNGRPSLVGTPGGAIRNPVGGNLRLRRCNLRGNDVGGATFGGAIYWVAGSIEAVDCTFENNTAASGSAIWTRGRVTAANTLFASNSSSGSAIRVNPVFPGGSFQELIFSNCTFFGNQNGTNSAISTQGLTSLDIRNCTIVGNSGLQGPISAYSDESQLESIIHISNSIIAGNTGAGDVVNNQFVVGASRTVTGGNNIWESNRLDTLTGDATFADLSVADVEDVVATTLSSEGGNSRVLALPASSPAINYGDAGLLPLDLLDMDGDSNTAEVVPFDQRGAGFPRVSGSAPDAGAFESGCLPVMVTNGNDAGTGSLRQAVLDVCDGGTVLIDNDPSGANVQTITLTSGEILLNKGVTILPALDGLVVIERNTLASPFRHFRISDDQTVSMQYLEMRGGLVEAINDVPTTSAHGGSILNAGDLSLWRCVFRDNSVSAIKSVASGTTDARGGAIYSLRSGLVTAYGLSIDECLFASCEAIAYGKVGTVSGGAVYYFGDTVANLADIRNSVFTSNTASVRADAFNASPGGYNTANPSARGGGAAGYLLITNSTFESNEVDVVRDAGPLSSSGAEGGAVSLDEGSIHFSTFVDNSALLVDVGGPSVHELSASVGNASSLHLKTITHSSFSDGVIGLRDADTGDVVVQAFNELNTNSGGLASNWTYNFIASNDSIVTAAPMGSPNAQGNFVGAAASPIVPLLGPLQDNGGWTLTRLPQTGSLLIDNGNPSVVGAPAFDQRGTGFDRISGGVVDIGSTEVQSGPGCSPSVVVLNANDSGAGSLRQAVLDVCDGGTITIDNDPSGANVQTITLTSGQMVIDKDVTITTVVEDHVRVERFGNFMNLQFRHFFIDSGTTVRMEYLQLENGFDQNLEAAAIAGGGSIRALGADLTLYRCAFWGNSTYLHPANASNFAFGGAVYMMPDGVEVGGLTAIECEFVFNRTQGGVWTEAVYGGAIANGGVPMTIDSCLFDQNTVNFQAASYDGHPVVEVAARGGAIMHSGVEPSRIVNSTFTNNNVFAVRDDSVNPNNRANAEGGAIWVSESNLAIEHSTFAGNRADLVGNQIGVLSLVRGGSLHVNVTTWLPVLTHNSFSGGIVARRATIPDEPSITLDELGLYSGSLPAEWTYNFVASNSFIDIILPAGSPSVQNNYVGTAISPLDPLLSALADNGGQTQTLLPDAASLLVNNGNPAIANPPDFDQRGLARIVGSSIDIGAVELQAGASCEPTNVVMNNNDSGPDSLRQAVLDVCDGGTITFDPIAFPAVGAPTIDLLTEIVIDKEVTISGLGVDRVVVRKDDGVGTSRLFYVNPVGVAVLEDMTLRDGIADDGGAVLSEGDTILRRLHVLDNRAEGEFAHGGGALVYTNAGTASLTVEDCLFEGNSAELASGAVGLTMGNGGDADLTIRGSALINNIGGSFGGAVYINPRLGGTAQVQIANTTVAGNQATTVGGLYFAGGDGAGAASTFARLDNVTVIENSSTNFGGVGFFLVNGVLEGNIYNSIIAGNFGGPAVPDININVAATVHLGGGNVIGNVGLANVDSSTPSDQIGTSANPIAARLLPVGYYGGFTPTAPPRWNSPAIDAGENSVLPVGLLADQRGDALLFPRIANGTVDSGAVEIPTFVVNVVTDAVDPNPGDGSPETAVAGEVSLRSAIMEANATPGPVAIHFDIPGPVPHVIAPGLSGNGMLPNVTSPAYIDATTDPDYPILAVADWTDAPVVALRGFILFGSEPGLRLAAGSDYSLVRGLSIAQFPNSGIIVTGFPGDIDIIGNYIGTDVLGENELANERDGISVDQGGDNIRIGGSNVGDGNLVSGHPQTGIYFSSAAGAFHTIQGNRIGTNAEGLVPLPNIGNGMRFESNDSVIGGRTAAERNIITSGGSGILLFDASRNHLMGNYVGVGSDGTTGLGVATFINGILLSGTSQDNIIGTDGDGTDDALEGNLVANAFKRANPTDIPVANANIYLAGSNVRRNVIAGNIVGLDVNGDASFTHDVNWPSNGDPSQNFVHGGVRGIFLLNASENRIGGPSVAERNVIGAHWHTGIEIWNNANDNWVVGNFIGVDPTGLLGRGNRNGNINVGNNSARLIIGTNGDGVDDELEGNVISHAGGLWTPGIGTGTGIGIDNANHVIAGNFIGTDVTGNAALSNRGRGIIVGGSTNLRIGGSLAAERNVISANLSEGVLLAGSSQDTVVRGNVIGLGADGATALGNAASGISAAGPRTMIGGSGALEGNTISSNQQHGIVFSNATAAGSVVQGNRIGVDVTGMLDRGNAQAGIVAQLSTDLLIGTDGDGVDDAEEGNHIANSNKGATIGAFANIHLSTISNSVVAGNLVGLDANGDASFTFNVSGDDVANGGNRGIFLNNGSNGIRIGGPTAAERNVIGASWHTGIELWGASNDNWIVGNYIGLDPTGTQGRGNRSANIQIGDNSSGNIIGTNGDGVDDESEGNAISHGGRLWSPATDSPGVTILAGLNSSNVIAGNMIGTDATGTIALGNQHTGVMLYQAANTRIGGSLNAERNIISGNFRDGVTVNSASSNVTLEGNYIGTDITGMLPLGNGLAGFVSFGTSAPHMIRNNLVSANANTGIAIRNGNGGVVQGNMMGTNVNGVIVSGMGNEHHGVFVSSHTGLSIGGTGAGEANILAGNGLKGIVITDASLNVVARGNSIYGNLDLGIDFLNNNVPEPNDPFDADTGPNNLQNHPVIDYFEAFGTRVTGTLHSYPNESFTLDFFVNRTLGAHSSGFGEGETYIGSGVVLTDGDGDGSFDIAFPPANVPGGAFLANEVITATATGPFGTSEFSPAYEFTCDPTIVVMNNNDSGTGSLRQAVLDVCDGGTITFDPTFFVDAAATPINLLSEIVIGKDLTITGLGRERVSIRRAHNFVFSHGLEIAAGTTVSVELLEVRFFFSDTSGSGDGGGAIVNHGDLTLREVTLRNSRARDGSLVLTTAGSRLHVIDSRLLESGDLIWSESGGAIAALDAEVVIERCYVASNRAASGGAFYGMDSNFSLINSTIVNNQAASADGGGYLYLGSSRDDSHVQADVRFSTIFINDSTGNPGLAMESGLGTAGSATFTMGQSILQSSGNVPIVRLGETTQTFADASAGYNHIQLAYVPEFDLPAPTNVSGVLQFVGPPAFYGGPTESLPLAANSPLRDAIPVADYPVDGPTTDQRGFPRPDGFTGRADIGATEIECSGTRVVMDAGDAGPGTLREAVTLACWGETITFDPTVFPLVGAPSIDLLSQINLTKDVVIEGLGVDRVVIRKADSVPESRLFQVNQDREVSFSELTLRDGYFGLGALVLNLGRVSFDQCHLLDSESPNTTGGAIFSFRSSPYNDFYAVSMRMSDSLVAGHRFDNPSPFTWAPIVGFSSTNSELRMEIMRTTIRDNSYTASGGLSGRGAVAVGFTTDGGFGTDDLSPATVILSEVTIENNTTNSGGMIHTVHPRAGVILIEDSTIVGNTIPVNVAHVTSEASQASGVLPGEPGELIIRNTRIANSTGQGVRALHHSVLIEESVIEDHDTTTGGGGVLFLNSRHADATGTIRNSIIRNNTSTSPGGGVLAQTFDGLVMAQPFQIIGSSIVSNRTTANAVGAIYGFDIDMEIIQSTIAGNRVASLNNPSAGSVGIPGVFFISDSTRTLGVRQSTIAGNYVEAGITAAFTFPMGIWVNNSGLLEISNSIVADNYRPGFTNLDEVFVNFTIAPFFVSDGGNLFGALRPAMFDLTDATDLKGTQAAPLTALLGPLQDNGGGFPTTLPLAGSPAIDAGIDANATALGLTEDQRGAGFPRFLGASVDIGAVESDAAASPFCATYIVLNANNDGAGSLRQTIIDACDGSLILFDETAFPAVGAPTIDLLTQIVIDKTVTVRGLGVDRVVVRKDDGVGTSRLFYVNPVGVAVLEDMTLRDGLADLGGAVRSDGDTTLRRLHVLENRAQGGLGHGGGAIVFTNTGTASLTVEECLFEGNTAARESGAVGLVTNSSGFASLAIHGSALINNQATNGGGAIMAIPQNGGSGEVEISNSTIAGNQSDNAGGMLFLSVNGAAGTVVNLQNVTVTDNASSSGGAVWFFRDTGSLQGNVYNSILANNAGSSTTPDYSRDASSVVNLGGGNIIGNLGVSSVSSSTPSDQIGTNASPIDPRLLPVGYYGGFTPTAPPRWNSPAIDAGENSVLPVGLLADQRGDALLFPRIANGTVDSGAVEIPTFVVNVMTDAVDPNPGDGSPETAVAGEVSLRSAIMEANATPGPVAIHFDIPGAGPHAIQINGSGNGALPFVTSPAYIDATTEPDYPFIAVPGWTDAPVVAVRQAGLPPGSPGVTLIAGSDFSLVRGLNIGSFPQSGILVFGGAGDIDVLGNYLGTDVDGLASVANGRDGVTMEPGGDRIRIGGPNVGDGNLISGNGLSGIYYSPDSGDFHTVQGNRIGTDRTGLAVLPNPLYGMRFERNDSLIGGRTAQERNIWAGSESNIYLLGAARNRVMGNYVGVGADGTTGLTVESDLEAIPPVVGSRNGILLRGASVDNFIGTDGDGVDDEFEGNVVANAFKRANPLPTASHANIWLFDAGVQRNVVAGNIVGLDVNGDASFTQDVEWPALGDPAQTYVHGGNRGIYLADASNNQIGGPLPAQRNVVGANWHTGIEVVGEAADNNVIQNNYVGVDPTGLQARGNRNRGVVVYDGPDGTIIGTDGDGVDDEFEGNIISATGTYAPGGNGDGVYQVFGTVQNTVIAGNLIGTDATGLVALGNTGRGIALNTGVGTRIGGSLEVERNVISGSGTEGVVIASVGEDILILGNMIGLGADGVTAMGNGLSGVSTAGPRTIVGGPGEYEGNIIGSNGQYGVVFTNATTTGGVVQGNRIGVDVTGFLDRGNAVGGIATQGATNLLIGTDGNGVNDVAEGNHVANSNKSAGVGPGGNFVLSGISNSVIAGNLVGLDANGDASFTFTIPGMPPQVIVNGGTRGIFLFNGSTGNRIGGTIPAERNVIGAHLHTGIEVWGGSNDNWVVGNYVGVDPTGTQGRGNRSAGIQIGSSSSNNVIGTNGDGVDDEFEGNVISHGGQLWSPTTGASGVLLLAGTNQQNVIAGNLIGTDADGTAVLGNMAHGIHLREADATRIGGSLGVERNVISGNALTGILVDSSGGGTQVIGNYLGTDITGLVAMGNGAEGFAGFATGSSQILRNNVISGNGFSGMALRNNAGNVVQGNFIGTDATGAIVPGLGNADHGIFIGDVANSLIGGLGAGEGNIIAGNALNGISVQGAALGVNIRGNSIFGNGELAIDLNGDGVTANDVQDLDGGPNGLQNFPSIGNFQIGGTRIVGTLNSTPNESFDLDFFVNRTLGANASGFGEGETYIGSTVVVTDVNGDAAIDVTFPAANVPGGAFLSAEVITATATGPNGTSEFGNAYEFTPVEVIDPLTSPVVADGGTTDRCPLAIQVLFSAPINGATFTAADIVLGNADLFAIRELDPQTFYVEIRPLIIGDPVTVQVDGEVDDLVGNPVAVVTAVFTLTQDPLPTDFFVANGDVYGDLGLIYAINMANCQPDETTVRLDYRGTYVLDRVEAAAPESPDPAIVGATGLPAIFTPVIIEGDGSAIDRDPGIAVLRHLYVLDNGFLKLRRTIMRNGVALGASTVTDIARGGSIVSRGNLLVEESHFEFNQAQNGGALVGYFESSEPIRVISSTFSNNLASNLAGTQGNGGAMNFRRRTTGVDRNNPPVEIINTTIVNNVSATLSGGATFFGNSVFRNSTVVGNSAGGAGGIFVQDGGGDPTTPPYLELANSIVAGNTASTSSIDIGLFNSLHVFVDGGYNLVGAGDDTNGGSPLVDGVNGNQVGSAATPLDPLLAALADNGGWVPTVRPLPGSPAIDFANPDLAFVTDTDARRVPRGLGALADRADIGAFEVNKFPTAAITEVHPTVDRQKEYWLQAAIFDSNNYDTNAQPPTVSFEDTINLETDGVFSYDGRPRVYGDFATQGHAVLPTVQSSRMRLEGSGSTIERLDSAPLARILSLLPNSEAVLRETTLQGGRLFTLPADPSAAVAMQFLSSARNVGGLISAVNSAVTLESMTLRDGFAFFGGAICLRNTIAKIRDTTVSENTTIIVGSVAFLSPASADRSLIENTTISGNVADRRILEAASPVLYNTSLTFLPIMAAGLAVDISARVDLVHSTITDNEARNSRVMAGGLVALQPNSAGNPTVRLRNTIVAGNRVSDFPPGSPANQQSPDVLVPNLSGNTTIESEGYNLIGVEAGGTGAPFPGFVFGLADLVGSEATPLDPVLGPLADNGGPTFTHALLEASPAIDHIPPGAPGINISTLFDQRGLPRPRRFGWDIGAYEVQAFFVPCNDIATLIDVINQSNANPNPDEIFLDGDPLCTGYDLDLTEGAFNWVGVNGLPTITTPITIYGQSQTIRRVNTAGIPQFRIFGVEPSGELSLDQITLENGLTLNAPTVAARTGGAILNHGQVRITNDSWLRNNRSQFGGAILNENGATLLVEDSRFTNNVGNTGGAIASWLDSQATIRRSAITDNRAEIFGGGVANLFGADMTIERTTIARNRSESLGGGVYVANNGSDLTITNSTISGNTSRDDGGGLHAATRDTGILQITWTTISNNSSRRGGGIRYFAPMQIGNSIVAGNSAEIFGPDIHGLLAIDTMGHNVIGDLAGNFGFDAGMNDITGGVGLPLDAGLLPLVASFGYSEVHPLIASSPAVDAGNPLSYPGRDHAGTLRPIDGTGDGNALPDIGSLEAIIFPVPMDSDNDGFSDDYENIVGTDPAQGLSIPTAAQRRANPVVFLDPNPANTPRLGDLNSDLRLDRADLQIMIRMAIGDLPPVPQADILGDGQVTVKDVTQFANFIYGEIDILR